MAELWRVVAQRQTQELTPDGRFVDVMEVSFEVSGTGTTGTVRIPLSVYTAENVRVAIDDYVQRIVDVHTL